MTTAVRKTNRFAIVVSIAVVAVLLIAGAVVVWMNSLSGAPAPRPAGAGVDQETGAVTAGTGADTVDLYFDFFCSHCQDFEDLYGPAIAELAADDTITLALHPVALNGLNAASGTDFSKRSANALYCVAEAEPAASIPFHQALFATHPSGSGATDDELIRLAAEAGATGVDECIADRRWDALVAEQTQSIPTNPDTGGVGTPTLLVNGTHVTLTGDPRADILDNLN